ncbi:MAG TPA: hypothetical protein PK040_01665 [Anaerolineaceae bacterium]|nr:hypothetical protein [Anaerolineaceae bacterium]
MSIKKSLWEYGKSVLRELIKEPDKAEGKKPARLEDLKLDDMKREKVRLDLEERKTLVEVRDLEAQKRKLFEEGVKAPGTREAKIIARKLKEVDGQAANLDRLLDSLSQQTRLINGLIQAKDLARIQKESGIGAMLQDFDLQELVMFIDNAYIDGEFNQAKINEMLGVLDGHGQDHNKVEDPDITEIMKQFESARDARDNPAAIDQAFEDLNKSFEEKRSQKEAPQSNEEL